jgi:two-component system, chemotaxis family, chemotaxis protein CheY
LDQWEAGEAAERLKVMIVDDNQDIRSVLSSVLKLDGLEIVATVEDGQAAVECAMEHQPDVVILDFMMPGIDGAETAKFLRAAAPQAMIIAFSGVIFERPEWADDFLPKGGVGEIAEVVERVMQARADEEGAAEATAEEPAEEQTELTPAAGSGKSDLRWT